MSPRRVYDDSIHVEEKDEARTHPSYRSA
jgi:hypothetical protein